MQSFKAFKPTHFTEEKKTNKLSKSEGVWVLLNVKCIFVFPGTRLNNSISKLDLVIDDSIVSLIECKVQLEQHSSLP